MASVVALKSNTGSTIAIIVAILAVLGITGFLVSRALKDFKLPDFNFNLPSFVNPFDTSVPFENVPPLQLKPQGFGIGAEQTAAAFRVGTQGRFIERSFGTRQVAVGSVAGVRGFTLAQRAVARRIPTFVGSITTSQGTRAIAGSQALFDRLQKNILSVKGSFDTVGSLAASKAFLSTGKGKAASTKKGFLNPFIPRVSQKGVCVSGCQFQVSKLRQFRAGR